MIRPIFTVKARILSERIPSEKKVIAQIKRNVSIGKADDKQYFEFILDSSRAAIYDFDQVTPRELFNDLANRNFSELDLADLDAIKVSVSPIPRLFSVNNRRRRVFASRKEGWSSTDSGG